MGEKRIGVALSADIPVAFPLIVLESQGLERDLEAIAALVREHRCQEVVVGLPRSLSGEAGREAARTEAFARALGERLKLPVVTWDERLTTVAAERRLREAGAKSARRREWRDAVAAALLLQDYLDSQRSLP